MSTFFFDDLNGSTLAGKSADVNFPTASTWANVDAALDGSGALVPNGSVTAGSFGSATYGPTSSTNVGVPLAMSYGPYGGSNGLDLRVEFQTPAVVQELVNDQYIMQCGVRQNGQYVFGRVMIITGDAVGTVRIRVYTSTSLTDATVTGVLPNTKYVAVIRTVDSGDHEMFVFNTTVACYKSITGSNGLHHVSLGAGLSGKVLSARVTEMTDSANASLTAPTMALASGSGTGATASASLAAPMATLQAGIGASRVQAVAPSPQLSAFGAGTTRLAPPTPMLLALGGPSTSGAALYAPLAGLRAYSGAALSKTAPRQTLAATGTATALASAALSAPPASLSANGKVSGLGQSALKPPSPQLVGYSGAVCSVSVSGRPTLAASGTSGGIGTARVTAPLFELTASATRLNSGSALLAAPVGRLATTGAAWLIAPGAQLTAIGSAVVAVTYEAYALNLKHQDPESPDELTRYTNFPFDRIVRYKNSYYGMNSTGLYLLEGTTDAGAPIPWSYRTHLTDFKSAQLKNIDTIYFGGRMGPASSVSVHVGEAGVQSYAYTTPRGIVAQNHRQTTGKGMRSRYYAVGASGEGEMTLDALTINVANLARKV